MRSIGIVGFVGKNPRLQEALEQIAAWAVEHPAVHFLANAALAGILPEPLQTASDEALRKCAAVVAVGGDGTVLSAARLVVGRKVPILGINAGKIGFLAEYGVDEIAAVLDALESGDFATRERLMLDCALWQDKKKLFKETVLNEAHLVAAEGERMVNLEVHLNGKHLTEYWADSLLLSTPTGSTGYNLSAGGPIVHPASDALVLNPVNPISLSVRPLVIPSSAVCRVRTVGAPVRLLFDGKPHESKPHETTVLRPGEFLELKRSRWVTRFVRTSKVGFVDALREKLGWRGKV
jgi:NAD+ kinase